MTSVASSVSTSKSAKDYAAALAQLERLDEVVEAYYTTGHYNIFIKIMTRSIDEVASPVDGSDPGHRRDPVHRDPDLAAQSDRSAR